MPQFMKRRRNRWYSNITVPTDLKSHFNGKSIIEKTLGTSDQVLAQAKARKLKGEYDLKFQALRGQPDAQLLVARVIYEEELEQVRSGSLKATGPHIETPEESLDAAYDIEIDEIIKEAAKRGFQRDNLPPDLEAKANALMDGRKETYGQPVETREEYEPTFKEIADKWLADWELDQGTKKTNTKSQYAAIIRLFKDFHGANPVRQIKRKRAVEFIDTLKTFSPHWGKSPKTKARSFNDLVRLYAGKGYKLSQGSLNRHIRTLSNIWKFAKVREFAIGDDPFEGLTKKAKSQPYKAWDDQELQTLFNDPPKRRDLHEVMLVAIYSGMRINEIATLTWDHLKTSNSIHYFDITDAKTEAGKRIVPIHSNLQWLLNRTKGNPQGRIWPDFNEEGVGKKAGEDASKLFGDFKRNRGFTSRQKVFHSFRKNVTQIIERAQVPVNEWQEIFGHEKDFTYKVYGGGIHIERKKDIIELLNYPEVNLYGP